MGFIHFSPGNREKSRSAEQSVSPCSIASAARCASGVKRALFPITSSAGRKNVKWRLDGSGFRRSDAATTARPQSPSSSFSARE
jgi:hypothetical protein